MLALVFYQTGMYGEFACGYLVLKGSMIMNCRGYSNLYSSCFELYSLLLQLLLPGI